MGLFAAALGAEATLSDMRPLNSATLAVSYSADGGRDEIVGQTSSLLNLLLSNAEANSRMFQHKPTVIELDWNIDAHVGMAFKDSPLGNGFSLILGSDITHTASSTSCVRLAFAISQLLWRPRIGTAHEAAGGIALIAHEARSANPLQVDRYQADFEAAARAVGLLATSTPMVSPTNAIVGHLIQLTHDRLGTPS